PRAAAGADSPLGTTSSSSARPPMTAARATSSIPRMTEASTSLHPERQMTFLPVAVARDHAPEHTIPSGRQRRDGDLRQAGVGSVHATVTLVPSLLVAILDPDADVQRLDGPIEPDP